MNGSQSIFLDVDGASISTSYLKAANPRPDGLTLVLLHGAGQSSTERYAAFADLFARSGVSVMALDFIGHGKTGGPASNNNLALRTNHALAAINHWTKASTPLILCGSSMSGHTVLRVAAQLGRRVKSLCLLQPAVYAANAEDVFFGPTFTDILHQPEGWRSSLALKDAANFEGKAVIAIGTEDRVIPWAVIEALMEALRQKSSQLRLEVLGGVGHELPTWIPAQTSVREQLVEYVTSY